MGSPFTKLGTNSVLLWSEWSRRNSLVRHYLLYSHTSLPVDDSSGTHVVLVYSVSRFSFQVVFCKFIPILLWWRKSDLSVKLCMTHESILALRHGTIIPRYNADFALTCFLSRFSHISIGVNAWRMSSLFTKQPLRCQLTCNTGNATSTTVFSLECGFLVPSFHHSSAKHYFDQEYLQIALWS